MTVARPFSSLGSEKLSREANFIYYEVNTWCTPSVLKQHVERHVLYLAEDMLGKICIQEAE